ncbi:MAG: calcium/sodium antiporter, partial [Clostridia bacterium]|nr:calcium/sodium antiporter [Clostridia bacterium]
GFGTSAPEMLVSVFSALDGSPSLALGNSWGSNICNISLILGVTALLTPVIVKRNLQKKEYPLLLLTVIIPLVFAADGIISRTESAFLLVFISLFVAYTVFEGLRARKQSKAVKNGTDSQSADEELQIEECSEEARNLGPLKSSLYTFFGLVLMVVSSKVIVFGAVEIAKVLEISEVIIGLTVVAVGTSLPELTASVIAARKGNNELAVGNIIGSNIFNNTAVLGLAGVILPYDVDRIELVRDGGFCLFLTMSLLLFSMRLRTKEARLGRRIGAFWVTTYIAYMALLVYMTMHHNSLPEFLSFISMK